MEGKFTGNFAEARRKELLAGQSPFATILTCSDSRTPPELIFDQGLGDLFVIRTAGNIVGDIGMGSLEYGGDHCGTPVMVILGHTKCGAVTAACTDPDLPAHLNAITEDILPSVEAVKDQGGALEGDAFIDAVAKENVNRVIKQIMDTSTLLKKRVDQEDLKILGGFYDMDSGLVEFW